MTYIPSYSPVSPYALTPIQGRFMGYYVHRPIPADSRDVVFVIKNRRYVYRPDNLAFDLYGDPQLWWVFGVRNHLQDPIFDIEWGRAIMIPNQDYIHGLIG